MLTNLYILSAILLCEPILSVKYLVLSPFKFVRYVSNGPVQLSTRTENHTSFMQTSENILLAAHNSSYNEKFATRNYQSPFSLKKFLMKSSVKVNKYLKIKYLQTKLRKILHKNFWTGCLSVGNIGNPEENMSEQQSQTNALFSRSRKANCMRCR